MCGLRGKKITFSKLVAHVQPQDMRWGLRRNVDHVWLETRETGGEVRGPRGVSSSDVVRERHKDVHYSTISNCFRYLKTKTKAKKNWKQPRGSFLENWLNKLCLEWERHTNRALKEEVLAQQGPWVGSCVSPHRGPPGRNRSWLGLGSGFSCYHTFLYIMQSIP